MVLITIEGIDGSGKSSLVSALGRLLENEHPVITREPGSTWVGESVRRAIAEKADPITEALLFVADHAAHIATVIRPALAAGDLVISDRYSDSRYAYQQVMLEGIIDEPLAWLRAIHDGWTIPPDLTFLIVLPIEEALSRMGSARNLEHFEEAGVLARVQENYLALAAEEPSRFVIIDGMKKENEIAEFVAGSIRDYSGWSRSRRRR
ncbi:MAG: dTMP kinase [Methanomicrobiales archaeon]|nr:dTMP kinase [Methanomicrobiales archaeon]